LGGQDTGKKKWFELFGNTDFTQQQNIDYTEKKSTKPKMMKQKDKMIDMLNVEPVVKLARQFEKTPAQVLLRWALDQGVVVIPKTQSIERLKENANIFDFHLSAQQIKQLTSDLQQIVQNNNQDAVESNDIEILTRLCWRSDPLRHLDFK
jgi:diketogulonate reductase-like aldo/keto reductase